MVRIALAAVSVLALACAAYLAGRRKGSAAERAALDRYLHDSVLPTLDALALGAPPDAARAHAAELRRGINGPTRPGPLAAELAAVVSELSLDAHLDLADDGAGLPAHRRAALRDATREALRNTMKHAGTDRAEVRVARRGGGVAVIIRDHGVGFDPNECRPGFGIARSIVDRMAEVGGRAEVESRPGWGTRVRLWVPR